MEVAGVGLTRGGIGWCEAVERITMARMGGRGRVRRRSRAEARWLGRMGGKVARDAVVGVGAVSRRGGDRRSRRGGEAE